MSDEAREPDEPRKNRDGMEAAGSEPAGMEAAGSEAAGSEPADMEAAGTETAGSEAAADDADDADDEDFEAMLEASLSKERRRLRPGEKVRARVVQVGRESLILDLGDGVDGLMDLGELAASGEGVEARVGDEIDAFVLRAGEDVVELGLRLGRGHQGRAQIEEAYEAGLPVQGRVAEVNKGGFVVEVGSARCFCPVGAMDLRFVEDPSTWVGQSLSFLITEMRGSRDVVLSRRRLLEQERERAAEQTREKLKVGARLPGRVTNVRDFGAFVDLGGIEGLIPASELGFGRERPQDRVEPGQSLEVEILAMETDEKGRQRLTLSLKSLLADPFEALNDELCPGLVLIGKVTRLQPFGAFVELVPGVEGLVHVSAFGRRVAHPSDVVAAGDEIVVRVDGVDAEKRRISLHLVESEEPEQAPPPPQPSGLRVLRRVDPPADGVVAGVGVAAGGLAAGGSGVASPGEAPRVGDIHEVSVDRVARFGVFVAWPGGRGLVLGKELGLPQGAEPGRKFPVGTSFKAVVVEVRDDGKVRLSKEDAERAEERREAESWRLSSQRGGGSGLGTIGDLFRAKKGD